MRPAYVSALFVVIGLALVAFSRYEPGAKNGPTEIARRVRQRTGSIFLLVALGLLLLDVLT